MFSWNDFFQGWAKWMLSLPPIICKIVGAFEVFTTTNLHRNDLKYRYLLTCIMYEWIVWKTYGKNIQPLFLVRLIAKELVKRITSVSSWRTVLTNNRCWLCRIWFSVSSRVTSLLILEACSDCIFNSKPPCSDSWSSEGEKKKWNPSKTFNNLK